MKRDRALPCIAHSAIPHELPVFSAPDQAFGERSGYDAPLEIVGPDSLFGDPRQVGLTICAVIDGFGKTLANAAGGSEGVAIDSGTRIERVAKYWGACDHGVQPEGVGPHCFWPKG